MKLRFTSKTNRVYVATDGEAEQLLCTVNKKLFMSQMLAAELASMMNEKYK